MDFKIKYFDNLTNYELYDILYLRNEIFVVEQKCAYQDIDNFDKNSYHIFCCEKDELVCSMRIIEPGYRFDTLSFGKIVVKKDKRKYGYAKKMFDFAMNYALNELKEEDIKLSAQTYIKDFYASFGFRPYGELEDHDGIMHINMHYKK